MVLQVNTILFFKEFVQTSGIQSLSNLSLNTIIITLQLVWTMRCYMIFVFWPTIIFQFIYYILLFDHLFIFSQYLMYTNYKDNGVYKVSKPFIRFVFVDLIFCFSKRRQRSLLQFTFNYFTVDLKNISRKEVLHCDLVV